jgi:hypothetical protein
MPRKPIDFSKTIIYKIVCKDLLVTQCYVGHTTDFTKRKHQHKTRCNNSNDNGYNIYVYSFIRENGGWYNWDMIEIEKYPCLDLNEAHKQERYWIETLNAELNKIIPTRTFEEWKNDNKEYYKIYHNKHKEQRNEYRKQYREKYGDEINRKRREKRALKKANANKET